MFSNDISSSNRRPFRKRMNRGRDRRVFSRTGSRTRSENFNSNPMRGGIRL